MLPPISHCKPPHPPLPTSHGKGGGSAVLLPLPRRAYRHGHCAGGGARTPLPRKQMPRVARAGHLSRGLRPAAIRRDGLSCVLALRTHVPETLRVPSSPLLCCSCDGRRLTLFTRTRLGAAPGTHMPGPKYLLSSGKVTANIRSRVDESLIILPFNSRAYVGSVPA
jgi:hypothetical protein